MHRALSIVYPDQCLLCDAFTDAPGALCGACWPDVPFLRGLVCDQCGTSLPGEADEATLCDDCMGIERPWVQGRAAVAYAGGGRKLVLGIKHGDRSDLVRPAARWMARAGAEILARDPLLIPVPLHWIRLTRRMYNQSAELARAIADETGAEVLADALHRSRATSTQEGKTVDERFANVAGAFSVRARFAPKIADRAVCLIDDVLTSGATLATATNACLLAGASRVDVMVLARVAKSP